MALSLYTAPASEPVTLTEAKAHCVVSTTDDDTLIGTLITAARQHAEAFTHRPFITQTWDWKLDAFPCDLLVLPLPPVSAISSIAYVDVAGDTQTWSSALYRTDLPAGDYAEPARVTPIYAGTFPSTQSVINAVTIRFVCGYGAAAAVPEAIKAAIKLLVAHWYMTREAVVVGDGVAPIPLGVESLLWPFKAF